MTDDTLFREEARRARQNDLDGRPRIIAPPGLRWLTLLLVSVITVAIVFATQNQYARKTTVTGFLDSRDGIKRIYSQRTGTLTKLFVKRGDLVAEGDTIAEFFVPSPVNSNARSKTLAEFDEQQTSIALRGDSLQEHHKLEIERVEGEVVRASRKIEEKQRISVLQHDKAKELRAIHDAALPLFESGQLSRLEWGRFREGLLNAQQQLEQTLADVATAQEEKRRALIAKHELPISFQSQLVALKQEASRLTQARQQFVSESGFTVKASVKGRVANLYFSRGESVRAHQAIISLVPLQSRLSAKLLIPTRAVGFVTPGQDVNLQYDAFPYQQFGTFAAELESLSTHALLPSEAPPGLHVNTPYFEAWARIPASSIEAYGEQVSLKNGMTLKADIVLDRRSLFEWLIEPLLVLRGRSH